MAPFLLYFVFLFISPSEEFTGPVTYLLRRSNRPCLKNEDCTTPDSYCYGSSMCLCKDGFIAINQNKTTFVCIKAAQGLGGNCLLDIQCEKALGSFAMCTPRSSESVGNCTCRQGAHFKEDKCYKTSKIGEKCIVHNNCHIINPNVKVYCTRGYDHKGICICPPGYHAYNNGTDCSPTSGLGGECTSDESCTAPNTKCLGRCSCKEKYILNTQKNKCLPAVAGLRSYCMEDIQCLSVVPNSICHSLRRKCVCSERYSLEKNGTCFPSLKINEPCLSDNECYPGSNNDTSIVCWNGYCQCAEGAKKVGLECILEKSLIAGLGGGNSSPKVFTCFWLLLASVFVLEIRRNKIF